MEVEWIKIALWLEVIGFGISVLIAGVIKIENIKRMADDSNKILRAIGLLILAYLLVPYVMGLFLLDEKWPFRGRWEQEKLDKLFLRLPLRQRLINVFKGIGILIVIVPVTLIILFTIQLPEYLLSIIAHFFKTREKATSWFLVVGGLMIFAGLVIELVNN